MLPRLAVLVTLLASTPARAADAVHVIEVGGSRIEVVVRDGPVEPSDAVALAWVDAAARAVSAYYRGIPLPRARIVIHVFDGAGVRGGTARGNGGASIDVALGSHTTPEQLARDWVLTHEMVHLVFPSLERRHHWMEEGLATYVEPLGRARAGDMSEEKIWGDLIRDMPQGEPRAGDRGLDFTPTWGRTYWGGALFWLMADVAIRERTGNAKGLEHALRAIAAAGGTIETDWSIDKVIAVGDAAIGAPVLRETYDRMKDKPAPVDLDRLWRRLGVASGADGVTFDAVAPLAAVRHAISFGR
jgi:hypothetical protein